MSRIWWEKLQTYLNKVLVANDSCSKCAREPITTATVSLMQSLSFTGSNFTKSFRAVSSLVKSSNLDAPSASANRITAPLALWIPLKVEKVESNLVN